MGYGVVVNVLYQSSPVSDGKIFIKKEGYSSYNGNHECSKHQRHMYKYLDWKVPLLGIIRVIVLNHSVFGSRLKFKSNLGNLR